MIIGQGVVTLVNGLGMVTSTRVSVNAVCLLSRKTISGTAGTLTWLVGEVGPGVSGIFVMSSSGTDAGVIGWAILE